MDWKIALIPAALFVFGLIAMVAMNLRGKHAAGVAQNAMLDYVREQLPAAQTNVRVINLLEDAVNAQHIWVVAYNGDGLYMIPTTPNPFTRTLKRYEDETPFDVRKQIAANLLAGNKSESIDFIPRAALTGVAVEENKKKLRLTVGDTVLKLRYQSKDCFGADQQQEIDAFLSYLKQIQTGLQDRA